MSRINRKRNPAKNLTTLFDAAALKHWNKQAETRNDQLHRYFNSLSSSIINSSRNTLPPNQKRRKVASINAFSNYETVEPTTGLKTRQVERTPPLLTHRLTEQQQEQPSHDTSTRMTRKMQKSRQSFARTSLSNRFKKFLVPNQVQNQGNVDDNRDNFSFPHKGDTDEDNGIDLKSFNDSLVKPLNVSRSTTPTPVRTTKKQKITRRKTANTSTREDYPPVLEQDTETSNKRHFPEDHLASTNKGATPAVPSQLPIDEMMSAEKPFRKSKQLPEKRILTSNSDTDEVLDQSISSTHNNEESVEKSNIGGHNFKHWQLVCRQVSLLREPIMFGGSLKHRFEAAQASTHSNDRTNKSSNLEEVLIQRVFKQYNKKLLHYFHQQHQKSERLQKKAVDILDEMFESNKNIYSEKFWKEAGRDLNFDYPKEFPACHYPSKSQYDKYTKVVTRIERLQKDRKNKCALLKVMIQMVYTMDKLKKADDKFLMEGTRINIGSRLRHCKELTTALDDATSIVSIMTNETTQDNN